MVPFSFSFSFSLSLSFSSLLILCLFVPVVVASGNFTNTTTTTTTSNATSQYYLRRQLKDFSYKYSKNNDAQGVSKNSNGGSAATASETRDDHWIIRCAHNKGNECVDELDQCGVQISDDFDGIDFVAVILTPQQEKCVLTQKDVLELEIDPVREVYSTMENQLVSDILRNLNEDQEVPYGVKAVNADQFWTKYSSQGETVTVCVMDTGIVTEHEDFDYNRISGSSAIVNPWNADEDSTGHGTHCAGTIGAADNNIGVVGVAPGVNLFIVRVFDADGIFRASNVVGATNACYNGGATVLSMSFGGTRGSTAEKTQFDRLWDLGVFSAAAAGNTGSFRYEYPASYAGVMSVGAVGYTQNIAGFSTYSDEVDIVAPGVAVKSISNQAPDAYRYLSGTSMATPHVAGVAALLKSVAKSDLTTQELWDAITLTATDLGDPGYDQKYGNGLINVLEAAKLVSAPPTTCGNGQINANKNEECDPPGNGCSFNCLLEPVCGNGIVERGETCDDGNQINSDGCDEFCQTECPDGNEWITIKIVPDNFGSEIKWELIDKDDGSTIVSGGPYADYGSVKETKLCVVDKCYSFVISDQYGDGLCCTFGEGYFEVTYRSQTIMETNWYPETKSYDVGPCKCGNGQFNPEFAEDCDGGDGCSSTCKNLYVCGNNVVDPDEECDDGNTQDFDGCSSECISEIPTESPSASPTKTPSASPTKTPSASPTKTPSASPSNVPTPNPVTPPPTTPPPTTPPPTTLPPTTPPPTTPPPTTPPPTTPPPGTPPPDTPPPAVCGNGIVEGNEECDDGNRNDDDGCSNSCTIEPYCGDGIKSVREECDDGNNIDNDGCSATCTLEGFCGDGIVDPGEECDKGSTGGEGCTPDCTIDIPSSCPDAFVTILFQPDNYANEVTWQLQDPSNAVILKGGGYSAFDKTQKGTDLCLQRGCYKLTITDSGRDGICCRYDSGYFKVSYNDVHYRYDQFTRQIKADIGECDIPKVCGDGILSKGEECDDGNTIDGDGCSSKCKLESGVSQAKFPVCGDGVLNRDQGEQCDDGNLENGDGCSSTCQIEGYCGDGIVQIELGEHCDNGSTNQDGSDCRSDCRLKPTCGNGIVDDNEECDDNNLIKNDGCSDTCNIEDIPIGDLQCDGDWLNVEIHPDQYGTETTWEVRGPIGNILMYGGPFGWYDQATKHTRACLPNNACYKFVIFDSVGDGLCCSHGEGSYKVSFGDQSVEGAVFSFSETHTFGQCDTLPTTLAQEDKERDEKML